MEKIDERIVSFLTEHHVLTLATSVNAMPYCANCFYVYLEKENILVFASDTPTKHAQDALKNSYVAGSVVLETSTVGKIQGIQFNGEMKVLEGEQRTLANKAYLKRFPYAILKKTELWSIEPEFIKMTDNRLGFGKKLIWGALREPK